MRKKHTCSYFLKIPEKRKIQGSVLSHHLVYPLKVSKFVRLNGIDDQLHQI